MVDIVVDIYDVFSLPAPPPPTWLSFYNGPDRARLPNFLASDDPVAAATKFLHGQIMFLYFPSLWIHVKIVTALASLFVLAAVAVIFRRLLQRTLWILRLKQTERGPLVVPNAIMIFAGTEGLFVILFLVYINIIDQSWRVQKQPLPNLVLWIALTWSPLIAGPIWSAFGLWHARPPSSIPRNTRSVKQSRFFGTQIPFPKSLLISMFWLTVPVIQLMTVFGPAFIGDGHRSEAVRLYYKWNEEYANATELSRPMLVELQTIWGEDLKAFYWLAITMFIWFAWTIILCFGYTFVNLRLLLPLRAQLLALEERHAKITLPSTTGGDTRVAVKSGMFDSRNKSQIDSVQLPLETPRLRSLAANYVAGQIVTVEYQDRDGDEDAKAVNEHWGLGLKDLKEDAVNTSFFPPTKPSAVIRPATDSETLERYLRAAYRHFLFQGTVVALSIVYFGQISLYIALTVYSYNERRLVGKAIDTASLEAMWGIVFSGSLVFISITLRTYEPMLVDLLNTNNSNIRPNWSALPSKDRSIKMNSLGSLRLHSGLDSKMSFSSSNATVVNSPTCTFRAPGMEPLEEKDSSDDDHKRWRADPESWIFVASQGSRGVKARDLPTISFKPTIHPLRRNDSVQSQTHLRKTDILASTRAPECEVPAYISRHRKSSSSPYTPIQSDDVQDQSSMYDKSNMDFLASTSSLNHRSLREIPSMGPGILRTLAKVPTFTPSTSTSTSAPQAQVSSPMHIASERFSSARPSFTISTNSGFVTTGGLGIGVSSTYPGLESVTALAAAGSMQLEDNGARAHRSAFMREMLSEGEATVLPPPPRSRRRPSSASGSS
ncbi:unnamed protein product [Tilletia controversa]|uniref:Uncharacterized protein n=3 Tax=Tilletia TaxID=13289 RepID=A0A8X7SWB4_9BASI|nr:hypothetical protein CF336_g3130 [Tilletia laevis]KAE8195425.1 hypothetical protein CF328_g4443 [Tilletia controversa]KAE8262073.1 hypothetical protein A4X03_0g2738 [Tilletia caries]KAE8197339.1 hypothetical protein CF335_g4638 [Tilletia laevis]KAE8246024.1 hypothetical protein A4X06_0g5246 [Tilletia controversa]